MKSTAENIGVATSESADGNIDAPSHLYLHLDVVDVDSEYKEKLHIYTFEDDPRIEELNETIDQLRQQYIFATGVVFPAWMDAVIDELETEVVCAVEWVIAHGYRPVKRDLSVIREELNT